MDARRTGTLGRMLGCVPFVLQTITISWFSPILRKGWRQPLQQEDLLPLPPHLECDGAYTAFLEGLSSLDPPTQHQQQPPQRGKQRVQPPGGTPSGTAGHRHRSIGHRAHGDGAAAPQRSGAGGADACTGSSSSCSTSAPPHAAGSLEQRLCSTRALLRLIWRLHGPRLTSALLLIYCYQSLVFCQPLLLRLLTQQLTHETWPDNRIWILPPLLFAVPVFGSVFKAQSQLCMIRIQIGLRTQLTAAVYRKCMRLGTGARAGMPSGRVVNLMSADVSKICDFIYPQLTFMAAAPLAVSGALVLLWFQIGWATLVGAAILALSTPVSNLAVRDTKRYRDAMLRAADVRLKLLGQLLGGIRVVKMNHWGGPQAREIESARSEELRALRNMIPSKVAMQTLLYVLPQLAGVASFAALAVAPGGAEKLTPGVVFSSLVLFQIMRFPLLTLSTGLVELGAAIISSGRIARFMAEEEQNEYVVRLLEPPQPPPYNALGGGHGCIDVQVSGGGGGGGSTVAPAAGPAGLALERGVTVRVYGFRWATVAPDGKREAAGGKGDGGREERPAFMEVVDRAGGQLALAFADLTGLLRRQLTRAGRSFARIGSSGALSQAAGAGGASSAEGGSSGPGSPVRWRRGDDEEAEDAALLAAPANPTAASSPRKHSEVQLLPIAASDRRQQPLPTHGSVAVCMTGNAALGGGGKDSETKGRHRDGGASGGVQPPRKSDDGGQHRGDVRREPFSLSAIDMQVRPGELVCVVGRVGSGKSSLLAGLLGEMDTAWINHPPPQPCATPSDSEQQPSSQQHQQQALQQQQQQALQQKQPGAPSGGDGVVALVGRVAYVAQQAWVVNGSLLDNVLMGEPLDEQRWATCVEACALCPDLALLPAGRDTEIGEKGVNLSGGQKQRLALARAMYQPADIYLLDDPLSAVDVHVASHIFNRCIRQELTSARRCAVLLVTHQPHLLPAADRLVVLDEGRVVAQVGAEPVEVVPVQQRGLGARVGSVTSPGQTVASSVTRLGLLTAAVVSSPPAAAAALHAPAAGLLTARAVPNCAPPQGSYASCLEEPLFSSLIEEFRAEQEEHEGEEQQQQQERGGSLSSGGQPGAEAAESSSARGPLLLAQQPATDDAIMIAVGDEASLLQQRRRSDDDGVGPGHGAGSRGRHEKRQPLLLQEQAQAQRSSSEAAAVHRHRTSMESARPSVSGSGRTSAPAGGGNSSSAAIGGGGGSQEGGKGRITVVEDRELGQVKWRVYGAYLSAFHPLAAVLMVGWWSAEQGARLATNTWLAHWTRNAAAATASGSSAGASGRSFTTVYLLLAVAYAGAVLLRALTNNLGSYRASHHLHGGVLAALMAAPLAFYEATPIGRILNRLSRDLDEIDYNLALYQQQLGNCIMRLLATLAFLCVLQPVFVAVVVPLALIYTALQKFFRRTSIELQRLESVSRSPVYANFSETMAGLDTIRAFGMQARFISRHERMVDLNAAAYHCARVADEWLSLRLDLLGGCIVLAVAAIPTALRHRGGGVSPSLVALALSEAIDLTSFLNYAVKVSALVESRYNAVERLLAYRGLEPEERPEEACRQPPPRPVGQPAWPATGTLELRDVWLSYRPGLDPVLKGVSFTVPDGSKVGVVGRTGSGKSSLLVALFRLVEPQRGALLLDGVDLRGLGLGAARTALAAIPQEPVLFSGSVRYNLDPWDGHTDAELWAALRVVALRDHVKGLGGLTAPVSEGGSNFSVGQRQLVCVARALLRQPRLLLADEATASVDPETDATIQRALRTHFKSCTVMAIAHRINTILDADKVLVMAEGKVAEYAPPQQLLEQPDSAFRAMARDAGLTAAAT